MHKSKFSFADLLTLLGAVVFGFFCFLSLNFLTFGKTAQSIGLAVIIALVIGGLAFGLKLLKTKQGNFKPGIVWEWIFLVLFLAVAFAGVFVFSHYFTVWEQRRGTIQQGLGTNFTQAENMFTEYESYADSREAMYKRQLKSVVNAKNIQRENYERYGFRDGTSDSVQIDTKTFALHAKLFPSNYGGDTGTKNTAIKWLANARAVSQSKWAFAFGIINVIKKMQTNILGWREELKSYSTFRAPGETATDFDYPLNINDVTDMFTKREKPGSTAIAYAAGLYLLMLLVYIFSKRSTKNHYSLFSFLRSKKKRIDDGIDINYNS